MQLVATVWVLFHKTEQTELHASPLFADLPRGEKRKRNLEDEGEEDPEDEEDDEDDWSQQANQFYRLWLCLS